MSTKTIIEKPSIIYTDAELIVDSRGTPAEAIWIRESSSLPTFESA